VTQSGGVVERDVDQRVGRAETVVDQMPVLIIDQVTADQSDMAEIEGLSSV